MRRWRRRRCRCIRWRLGWAKRGLELALNGGEDYELLFAAGAGVKVPRGGGSGDYADWTAGSRGRGGDPGSGGWDGERSCRREGGSTSAVRMRFRWCIAVLLSVLWDAPADGGRAYDGAGASQDGTGYPGLTTNHLASKRLTGGRSSSSAAAPFVELREEIWLSVFEHWRSWK